MRGSNAIYNKPEWIGQKFGRLTVLDAVRADKGKLRSHWEWICQCDCGNIVTYRPSNILRGTTKSCGCLSREIISDYVQRKKGKYPREDHRRLWWKYSAMKSRCNNPKHSRYEDYGGRGIKLCDSWNESFDNFADWAYSHGYKEGLTIERIDVEGDYCPENCVFITLEEQARNKRNTLWVEYHGERVQLIKLCEMVGASYFMVKNRIKKMGWSVEQAVETPSSYGQYTLADKCREHNISYRLVKDRIKKLGWDEERALTTPVKKINRDGEDD